MGCRKFVCTIGFLPDLACENFTSAIMSEVLRRIGTHEYIFDFRPRRGKSNFENSSEDTSKMNITSPYDLFLFVIIPFSALSGSGCYWLGTKETISSVSLQVTTIQCNGIVLFFRARDPVQPIWRKEISLDT